VAFGFDALFYFFFLLDDLFLNCRRIHPDTDRKKKTIDKQTTIKKQEKKKTN
jgi:hypothetical protein